MLSASTKNTKVAVSKLKFKQKALLQKLQILKETDKRRREHAGRVQIEKIKKMNRVISNISHENLPIDLYREVQVQLEQQVERISEQTRSL